MQEENCECDAVWNFGRVVWVATGWCLLAYAAKGDVAAKYPDPEDATVKNGVFQDDYFGLRYPLPPGWVEDLKGPEPSASGYYSLAALKPEGELVATMQISAQDNFFAAEPMKDATDFLNAMKKGLDASLSAPHAVAHVKFGGLDFARLDYSGAGLSHIVFATEIRCHTLIFSITASRESAAEMLVESLGKLSFAQDRTLRHQMGPRHGAAGRFAFPSLPIEITSRTEWIR